MRWIARFMAIILSLLSIVLIISFLEHLSQTKDSTLFLLIIIVLALLVISYFISFFNERLGGAFGLFLSVILILLSNPFWIIILYPIASILFLCFGILSSDMLNENSVQLKIII
ncbi:MAG: hypothetical protein EPN82_04830 [Bacteroidetes bacterium]|nr:MAG: hypothetical protein EPN82_04830 [Bacteroidota bacterium]